MLISFALLSVQTLSSPGSAARSPQVDAQGEDPGDAIGRCPVPQFIVILGRINTHFEETVCIPLHCNYTK